MRDWKMRHQNAEVEYAGLEIARKGKVWNTASFLEYHMHIFQFSHQRWNRVRIFDQGPDPTGHGQ